jgi:hypothetical protein
MTGPPTLFVCFLAVSAWAGTSPILLEGYEGPGGPRLEGEGRQPGSRLALSAKEPFQGKQCAELHYVFKADAKGLQYLEAVTPRKLPAGLRKLSVAVRGDGSGEAVRARFVDAKGEWHQFDLGKVDFQGWRVLSADLTAPHGVWGGDANQKLDYPVTFHSLVLDSAVKPAEGTVAFDAVAVEAEAKPEDFLDARFEPTKPLGYFWGRENRPGGKLIITNGSPQPVSGTVAIRILNHREEPVGEPRHAPVAVEPGRTAEVPVPLSLERFGVYFIEVQLGGNRQRFSLAWLPGAAPIWPDSPFGVCTHFGQHKHKVPDTLELILRMGAVWIRDEISWGGCERKKGEFRFDEYADRYMAAAGKLGIRPLIIFDYGNDLYDKGDSPRTPEAIAAFTEYCRQLMRRYEAVCRDWEIWNEPNIFFWRPKPNVEDYTSLMKAVYPATKQANPKATIVGVCTAGTDLKFVEGVLERGGGKAMDAISVHPYRYPRPPEAPKDFLDEMNRLKALLDKHGAGHLKVWLTEYGYPTQLDQRGVSQWRSGALLVRTSLLALSLPFVERLFIYDFQDDGVDPLYNEANFGVIRFDGSPKPAYAAHATMARMLFRKRFARSLPLADSVHALEFTGEEGTVLAAWTSKEPATLVLPTTARRVTVTDLMGNETVVPASASRITLPLTEEPLFLTPP